MSGAVCVCVCVCVLVCACVYLRELPLDGAERSLRELGQFRVSYSVHCGRPVLMGQRLHLGGHTLHNHSVGLVDPLPIMDLPAQYTKCITNNWTLFNTHRTGGLICSEMVKDIFRLSLTK